MRQPLSLTATPQEFDAEFLDALRGYREVRKSLTEQAEATKEVIEAAKAASVKKASEATSKATKPTAKPTPAPTTTAPSTGASTAHRDDEKVPETTSAEPQAMDLFG